MADVRPRYSRIVRSSGATGWATIPVARRQRRRSPLHQAAQGGTLMKTIGVDVGGTFTDIVYVRTPSATSPYPQDVHDARTIRRAASAGHRRDLPAPTGSPPPTSSYVFHGTTIATNAVLEHKGARDRHGHERGLPRHHPHRAPPARRALLDHAGAALAEPAAGQAPAPQGRERAARSAARRRAGAARRGRRARGGRAP